MEKQLFLCLFKHSDRAICGTSENEITDVRNSESPDSVKMGLKDLDLLVGVTVKLLHSEILGTSEEIMSVLNEFDLSDSVLVDEHGLVAVSEVETPQFDGFVCGSCGYKGVV